MHLPVTHAFPHNAHVTSRFILSLLFLTCMLGCSGGGGLTTSTIGPTINSLTVNPTTIKGGSGNTVNGTVTISFPAPSGGVNISLTSSNTGAAQPPSVATISVGATSTNFTITTSTVTTSTAVTITGTTNGSSQSAQLTVTP